MLFTSEYRKSIFKNAPHLFLVNICCLFIIPFLKPMKKNIYFKHFLNAFAEHEYVGLFGMVEELLKYKSDEFYCTESFFMRTKCTVVVLKTRKTFPIEFLENRLYVV